MKNSRIRCIATLLVSLLTLGSAAQEKNKVFWKLESEKSGKELSVATFAAQDASVKGQGILIWALWPDNHSNLTELDPAVILAGLYRDLKGFQLQGRKEASWGDSPAQVVAFKATVDKRTVAGRALMTCHPDGTQVLLLVSHPEAQPDFSKEFERLQRDWQFSRQAKANVLYSR